MNDLKFSFLNGRLLYIDDKKDFIGYDPIFSEPMDYPGDGSGVIKKAEHNFLLDGETFNVRIKETQRRSWGGFGLLGLEVFLDGKHMTTHLGFSSLSDNSKYGSRWFFHNDSYFYLSGGWDFKKEVGDSFVPFDCVPMEEKYRKINKEKLYLVKFKTFTGHKPYSENTTIEKIVTTLFVREKSWTHPLLKTLEAWDLKPFERISTSSK